MNMTGADVSLRVGIVGIGNIGSAHANSIYKGNVKGMKLCALCDNDADVASSLALHYPDVPVFSEYSELFGSGIIDAVVISTPHYFHPPIAIEAFRHGLHVLTEKPAGVDCASVKEMCEAARLSKKVFGVMFNQRANKLFGEAKRIVSSGELGELRRVVWIITNWYRKQCYYDSGSWRATWSGEGGGVLLNQAPHNLDLWQWICGMPKALRAECYVSLRHSIEVEDDATIFAEYENGATAVFITSTGDYPGTNRLEITGSRGKLVLEGNKLTHTKLSLDEAEYRLTEEGCKNPVEIITLEDEKKNCHCAILENFADSVLNGTPLLASGFEAINELEISNAAYLSAWLDKKIYLPVNDAQFSAFLNEKRQTSAMRSLTKKQKQDEEYSSRWDTNW